MLNKRCNILFLALCTLRELHYPGFLSHLELTLKVKLIMFILIHSFLHYFCKIHLLIKASILFELLSTTGKLPASMIIKVHSLFLSHLIMNVRHRVRNQMAWFMVRTIFVLRRKVLVSYF